MIGIERNTENILGIKLLVDAYAAHDSIFWAVGCAYFNLLSKVPD